MIKLLLLALMVAIFGLIGLVFSLLVWALVLLNRKLN